MSTEINELKAALEKMREPLKEACSTALTNSHLNLENQNITYKELEDVVIPFVKLYKVQDLNLRHNHLDADSARLIARKLIKRNSFLITLDLGHNQLGEEGARSIAFALKKNFVLKRLKLWHNEVGAVGAYWLAEALKVNATLSTLDLWNNGVGVEGANAMKEALSVNHSLKKLELGNSYRGESVDDYLSVTPLDKDPEIKGYLKRNIKAAKTLQDVSRTLVLYGYLDMKQKTKMAKVVSAVSKKIVPKNRCAIQ
jgi:hypothetical protein